MHAGGNAFLGTIVPMLRYRDVAAAIDWLCGAFGFERHVVVKAADGSVRYAELIFGDGMIMLGPAQGSAIDGLMTQPEQAGGAETQICYLFVDDPDAHCAKAKLAGAEIVLDIEEEGRRGRGYSYRDPEGHIWNFGTYNPWRRQPAKEGRAGVMGRVVERAVRRLALGIGLLFLGFAAAVVVAWAIGIADPPAIAAATPPREAGALSGLLRLARAVREPGEGGLEELRDQLVKERLARESADRLARGAHKRLAQERRAREAAERAAREAGEQLVKKERDANSRERTADLASAQRIVRETREQLALVERTARETREQLDAERAAREAAERAGKYAGEQLAKEHAAKEAAERMAREAREQLGRERRRALRRHHRAVQHFPDWTTGLTAVPTL